MKTLSIAFISELIGTAILVFFGLSAVIIMFGSQSPLIPFIPNPGLRRLVTGFLFGSTGALVAISPVGRISGAHINPVLTLAFWLRNKMAASQAAVYILGQFIGASFGAIPLLLWGRTGRSIYYGATVPAAQDGPWIAVLGEFITTFIMITGLFIFVGHKRIRSFAPLLFPFLYAVMVYIEAPISGTSTNPARSFGPAFISGNWQYWWVYWVGPVLGAISATIIHRYSWLSRFEIKIAKIYHFERDPYEIFGVMKSGNQKNT